MVPMKVGVVGCGNISGLYFQAGRRFEAIEIIACADMVAARAEAKAREYGLSGAMDVDALLQDSEVELVLNLTVPKAHAEIGMRALDAGKHVYNEKPLTLTREEGAALLELAARRGVRVGCAPDTVLGAGLQTARKVIDDGWIGKPVSATAFMVCHGHEGWHPDPEFYYEVGGGPMFDMGPYYLTTLVTLLGPATHVTAVTRAAFPERLIASHPKKGKRICVETPTHLTGAIEFADGVVATMITSFDVWRGSLPCIEIHGTEGSLSVPDPNAFGGEVKLYRPGFDDWRTVPMSHGYADQSRGLGVADMAHAIRSGREHRASGALACHVLDIMQAFIDAGESGRRVALTSECARPAPMPMHPREGRTEP